MVITSLGIHHLQILQTLKFTSTSIFYSLLRLPQMGHKSGITDQALTQVIIILFFLTKTARIKKPKSQWDFIQCVFHISKRYGIIFTFAVSCSEGCATMIHVPPLRPINFQQHQMQGMITAQHIWYFWSRVILGQVQMTWRHVQQARRLWLWRDLDSFRMALNSQHYQRTALHAWAFIVIENAR